VWSNAGMANRQGRRLVLHTSLRPQSELWLGLAWPSSSWLGSLQKEFTSCIQSSLTTEGVRIVRLINMEEMFYSPATLPSVDQGSPLLNRGIATLYSQLVSNSLSPSASFTPPHSADHIRHDHLICC
jgi:hypothetical protein